MLDKIIENRRSAKKFSSKKPDWRTIIECIDSMRYAPMSGNNFSLKFILVTEIEKIKEIAKYSEQPFISKAHFVLVVLTNPSKTVSLYKEKGKKYLKQQAGAAIQNFLLKITKERLSTCWIGHFNENRIKHLLNIPEDLEVEALFPIGYEVKREKLKRKIDLDNVLYFDKYNNKKMNPPKKLDV